MSGPKRAQVKLKLNHALDIFQRSAADVFDNASHFNQNEFNSMNSQHSAVDSWANNNSSIVGVDDALRHGNTLRTEAEQLRSEAKELHQNAVRQGNHLKSKCQSLTRELDTTGTEGSDRHAENAKAEGYVVEAGDIQRQEERAASLLRQSSEKANAAKTEFGKVKILVEQRQEADRQRELKRTAASNDFQATKNEAESFGAQFLSEWSDDTGGHVEAQQTLRNAENSLHNEHFEQSQTQSSQARKLFQDLYAKAIVNKQRFDCREVIADAIITALDDLQYDAPDVNYTPKGQENAMLGNITIFVKSKGKAVDMRLEIDLNGNVAIEVPDVPEGNEAECHHAITDLQEKIASIADLRNIRGARWKDNGNPPKQKVGVTKQKLHAQEQVKQRGV